MRFNLKMISTVLALGLSVGACSFYKTVGKHTVSYNRAQASSANQIILLNILRAKDRQPLHFGKLLAVTGTAKITTIGSLSFPFGQNKSTSLSTLNAASASLNLNVGPIYNYQPEDTKEFMTGISNPIDMNIIRHYWDQGWPRELLLHMLIRKIEVVKKGEDGEIELLYSMVNQPGSWPEFRIFQETLRRLRRHLRIAKSSPPGEFVGPRLDSKQAAKGRLLAALLKKEKEMELVTIVKCEEIKKWQDNEGL